MKTRKLQTVRAVFIILLLTMIGMANTFAQKINVGKLKYSIIDDKSVSITGYVDDRDAEGRLDIPRSVTYNGITYSVISIEDSAFAYCPELTSVTIPNSVKIIGFLAFRNCTGLTSIIIPDSVEEIGNGAFDYCTGLTSITFPNSVNKLSGFDGCTGLNSVIIPNSVTELSGFSYCTGLTSITIPNSVTKLSGFSYCTGLTSITIPNSVTELSMFSFSYCTGLTSITIPNSVTTIGAYAFEHCTGLTFITIPDSVEEIQEGAFEYCTGLTSITISPNTKVADGSFKDNINLLKMPKYHGRFEMPGFGYFYSHSEVQSAKKEGVAHYRYKEAKDLTRIFEGDFFFAINEEDLAQLMREDVFALLKNISDYSSDNDIKVVALLAPFAIGEFKDDKQVGKWIWGYWADGMFVYKEITYDDYGNANGPIKQYRYAINYSDFRHSASYRNNNSIYYPSGWLIGEFVDNILVSADYRVGYKEVSNYNRVTDPYEVSGKFNRRGPVGRWSVSGGYFEDDGKYTVVEFDNNGYCIANYWIDQSTGDKKFPRYSNSVNNPIQYIEQAQTSIYKMVYTSCFRSTKKQE